MLNEATRQVALEALRDARVVAEYGNTAKVACIDAAIAEIEQAEVWEPNADGLLPCPFCRGNAEIVEVDLPLASGYYVACIKCDGQMGDSDDTYREPSFAIENWNYRAAIAELEQLQPAPIYDDPNNDPFGVHTQRWIRVDWNTAAALQMALDGDVEGARIFIKMLLRQAEDALNTPQPAPSVPDEYIDTLETCVIDSMSNRGAMTEQEFADWQAECRPVLKWLQQQRQQDVAGT